MVTLRGLVRFASCGLLGVVGYFVAMVAAELGVGLLNIEGRLPIVIWAIVWFLAPVLLVAAMCAVAYFLKCADHLVALAIVVATGIYCLTLTVDSMKSDVMVARDGRLYIREEEALSRGIASEPERWEFVTGYFEFPELMAAVGLVGYVVLPLVAGGITFLAGAETSRNEITKSSISETKNQSVQSTSRYPEFKWPE